MVQGRLPSPDGTLRDLTESTDTALKNILKNTGAAMQENTGGGEANKKYCIRHRNPHRIKDDFPHLSAGTFPQQPIRGTYSSLVRRRYGDVCTSLSTRSCTLVTCGAHADAAGQLLYADWRESLLPCCRVKGGRRPASCCRAAVLRTGSLRVRSDAVSAALEAIGSPHPVRQSALD